MHAQRRHTVKVNWWSAPRHTYFPPWACFSLVFALHSDLLWSSRSTHAQTDSRLPILGSQTCCHCKQNMPSLWLSFSFPAPPPPPGLSLELSGTTGIGRAGLRAQSSLLWSAIWQSGQYFALPPLYVIKVVAYRD